MLKFFSGATQLLLYSTRVIEFTCTRVYSVVDESIRWLNHRQIHLWHGLGNGLTIERPRLQQSRLYQSRLSLWSRLQYQKQKIKTVWVIISRRNKKKTECRFQLFKSHVSVGVRMGGPVVPSGRFATAFTDAKPNLAWRLAWLIYVLLNPELTLLHL